MWSVYFSFIPPFIAELIRFLAVYSEDISLSCPYSGETRDCTWEIYVKSVCLASEQQSKTIFNAVHHPESLWNWAALEIWFTRKQMQNFFTWWYPYMLMVSKQVVYVLWYINYEKDSMLLLLLVVVLIIHNNTIGW